MASSTATKASQIGWMFVPQYYTFVNKDPARLHCFYTKRSTLIHGVEGEDCQPCYGQQEIHEKIMSLGFEDCKVFVSTVDSQSSAESGIIVQVVGELSNKGGAWRKFAQTFFLAEQPNGYFVLNDIFRYIKEESDEDETHSQTGIEQQQHSSGINQAQSGQDVTYDQLANASIVQPSSSSNAHPHQDFELSQQHGAPGDAAGVTVAPPDQSHQGEARASLEGLVNGDISQQQQVVDLQDDLVEEQQPEVSTSQGQSNGHEEVAPQQIEEEKTVANQLPSEIKVPDSGAAPAESIAAKLAEEQPEEAAPTAASSAPVASNEKPAPSTSAAAQPVRAEPPKPSAPKTWANLAAAGSNKWKTQVMSDTRGVSSTGVSGSSTPAGPSSDKGEAAASTQASSSGNNRSTPAAGGDGFQQAQRGPRSQETRTPSFTNVETGFSIVVGNITENISHGLLRQRLSDEFAQVQGGKKDWAKLSYLDIDRQKGVAYVDFEKEWALKRALEKGTCVIEGTTVSITGGKGGRRDASGFTKGSAGGKGRGDGQGPRTGGSGGGQQRNASGANRGGREGQGQGQGQNKSQRGGRGGGGQ